MMPQPTAETLTRDDISPHNLEKLRIALGQNPSENRNSLQSRFYDCEDYHDLGSKYYKLGKSAQNILKDNSKPLQIEFSPNIKKPIAKNTTLESISNVRLSNQQMKEFKNFEQNFMTQSKLAQSRQA